MEGEKEVGHSTEWTLVRNKQGGSEAATSGSSPAMSLVQVNLGGRPVPFRSTLSADSHGHRLATANP